MGDKRAVEGPLETREEQSREKIDGHLRDDAYAQVRQAGNQNETSAGRLTQELLEKAHEVNERQGFAKAKPIFEEAIAAADKIDINVVNRRINEVKEAIKTETGEQMRVLIFGDAEFWSFCKNASFISRLQMAVAQNNSGDYEGARVSFDQLSAKYRNAAREVVLESVLEANARKQELTQRDLLPAVGATPADDLSTVDNPTQHILKASYLFDPGDPARRDAKGAESEWKKAIELADKLELDVYRGVLAATETRMKNVPASEPVTKMQLGYDSAHLQDMIDLPITVRALAAEFYLQNQKPAEARAMLAQALVKDPTLAYHPQFKSLLQSAQEKSEGINYSTKAQGLLKSVGKEIVSDGISGGIGLAVFSMTPGRFLKLGSALLAGGSTKHFLSLAGLGGDASSPLKNFAWGGVSALAMLSGATVRQRLSGAFEQGITSDAAGSIVTKAGITQAEKLALVEGQLDGLKRATAMLTENVAVQKAAYKAELNKALSAAPWHEKPAIWLRDKFDVFGAVPTERLAAVKAARQDYRAARGGWLDFLNPLNMFRAPANFNGTLQNLEGITFWNRFKIDATSTAATSFVYRGAHEGAKIGDIDPVTGRKFSAYDAVVNTAMGTAVDALGGAVIVGSLRAAGSGLSARAGISLSEQGIRVSRTLPLQVRDGLAALPTAGALFSPQLSKLYTARKQAP